MFNEVANKNYRKAEYKAEPNTLESNIMKQIMTTRKQSSCKKAKKKSFYSKNDFKP